MNQLCVCVLVAESCPTLCDPMDSSLPGPSVHGILQARILEWVATPSPGELPHPGSKPEYLALTGIFSTTEPPVDSPKNCADVHAKSLQLCPTVCDPTDCSPPGSSVRGILQARILEWLAIFFYRGSSRSRDRIHISCISCIELSPALEKDLPFEPP